MAGLCVSEACQWSLFAVQAVISWREAPLQVVHAVAGCIRSLPETYGLMLSRFMLCSCASGCAVCCFVVSPWYEVVCKLSECLCPDPQSPCCVWFRVCTWLSYDGGMTWMDVADGTQIYEYADWGGIVVMAKHELAGPADSIKFSYDYGRCWKTVPLDQALHIENIRCA